MKWILTQLTVLLLVTNLNAQTSLKEINLKKGNYEVGFQHYFTADSTRTYSMFYEYTNKKVERPISVSIWYPAQADGTDYEKMAVLEYFEVLKEEEEWSHLPNDQLLNWFYYPNTPSNQQHLEEQTNACQGATSSKGKFPVIVYAPSFQASSIENFALFEYLASHGFIVIASPSRGTETRWFSNNFAKELETQARDVEFLIKEVHKFSAADPENIALMGFSFGGLANVVVQNRNDAVKAVISLDGTERYQYGLLEKSPFFDPKKIDVPYIHMAQKDIPTGVLLEDGMDSELNWKFQLFDSLSNSKAYKLKFNDLTHSYFSTLGVLFANRDERQDKSDLEIMQSYKLVSANVLQLLNIVLKDSAKEFQLIGNVKGNRLIDIELKEPLEAPFTFQDFNDLAINQNYKNLSQLYPSVRKKHDAFNIREGDLNRLGLQLVFNPNTPAEAIRVFLFATSLYPSFANLYDSLAEGYLFLKDRQKAIESFEKSLALNPQNQNAIDRLKQLKE